MKKSLLIIIVLCASGYGSIAQSLIALHHSQKASFYSSFDSLKVHVQQGDTIYLPGGGVNIGNWQIDKQICVIGCGHYPDSTAATKTTYLTGNITLLNGADNTFLQGFYLTGNITFGTNITNQVVNNITISRCSLNNLFLSYTGAETTLSSNIIIRENIIRGDNLAGGYAKGVLITNNIIQGIVSYFDNMLFTNNIQMRGFCWNGPFSYINNSTMQNNIMNYQYASCSGNYFMSNCNSNNFTNNIFNQAWAFPDGSSTGSGNWMSIDVSSIFVNQSGLVFDYTQNYHLKTPNSYIGTDGKEAGIYGGISPYKEGVVPFNPHIQSKTIPQATDNSGNLNINIKVKAQDN